jgi:hypothetical protein
MRYATCSTRGYADSTDRSVSARYGLTTTGVPIVDQSQSHLLSARLSPRHPCEPMQQRVHPRECPHRLLPATSVDPRPVHQRPDTRFSSRGTRCIPQPRCPQRSSISLLPSSTAESMRARWGMLDTRGELSGVRLRRTALGRAEADSAGAADDDGRRRHEKMRLRPRG